MVWAQIIECITPLPITRFDISLTSKICKVYLKENGVIISKLNVWYLFVFLDLYRREQMNVVTSYIDGSMVYGSTDAEMSRLRESYGGRFLLCIKTVG